MSRPLFFFIKKPVSVSCKRVLSGAGVSKLTTMKTTAAIIVEKKLKCIGNGDKNLSIDPKIIEPTIPQLMDAIAPCLVALFQ